MNNMRLSHPSQNCIFMSINHDSKGVRATPFSTVNMYLLCRDAYGRWESALTSLGVLLEELRKSIFI